MSGPSPRKFGAEGKALSELSDEELLLEVQARRQRRKARGASKPGKVAGTGDMVPRPLAPQARQWLANLELDDSATLGEVEAAYRRLLARYGPLENDANPERRAAARALLASLKKAHDGLLLHFNRVQ